MVNVQFQKEVRRLEFDVCSLSSAHSHFQYSTTIFSNEFRNELSSECQNW